jgi:hypothetical protein
MNRFHAALILVLIFAAGASTAIPLFGSHFARRLYSEWFYTNDVFHELVAEMGWSVYSVDGRTSNLRLGIPGLWSDRNGVTNIGVDDPTGEVGDGWGNPIYIETPETQDYWIRMLSFGANGIDDDGQGDDREVFYGPEYATRWSDVPIGIQILLGPASWLIPAGLLLFSLIAFFRCSPACRRTASNAIIGCGAVFVSLVAFLWVTSGTPQVFWESTEWRAGVPLFSVGSNGTAIIASTIRETSDPNCFLPSVFWGCGLGSIPPEAVIPVLSIRFWRTETIRPCSRSSQLFLTIPFPSALALMSLLVMLLLTPRCVRKWRSANRRRLGHCLGCGYNLKGLPEPRCPECGLRFDPNRSATP